MGITPGQIGRASDFTGLILMYGGETPPIYWLSCDGSEVSRSTYSDLFDIVGVIYGAGDGSTTFNLPNLKGRVAVGINTADSDFNSVGKIGGSKTHTLTVAEIPAHSHFNRWGTGTSRGGRDLESGNNNPVGNTEPTADTGGGGAHANVQPYLVMNYIIKT